jgi:hypothetical protein
MQVFYGFKMYGNCYKLDFVYKIRENINLKLMVKNMIYLGI